MSSWALQPLEQGLGVINPSSFCVALQVASWSSLGLMLVEMALSFLAHQYKEAWNGKYCLLEFTPDRLDGHTPKEGLIWSSNP